MSNGKRKRETVARVSAVILGVFLLLWSAVSFLIYDLGDVTEARDVSVSRTKGERQDEASDGKNYRFSVSYIYTVDGVDYDGLDTGVRGEWLGPEYDGTVHYLPFAPRISSMYAEAMNTRGALIPVGLGLALILLGAIPRRSILKKTARAMRDPVGAALESEEPVTMAWLMEHTEGYDDRLEEYYQNGWDEGDPSWQCPCGKWNTGTFCESCGKRAQ